MTLLIPAKRLSHCAVLNEASFDNVVWTQPAAFTHSKFAWESRRCAGNSSTAAQSECYFYTEDECGLLGLFSVHRQPAESSEHRRSTYLRLVQVYLHVSFGAAHSGLCESC